MNATARSSYVLLMILLFGISAVSLSEQPEHMPSNVKLTVKSYIDPDIIDSEWNHHFAGYILIASALAVILGKLFFRLSFLKSTWMCLFAVTAIFLAIWSDKEVWPRGVLNWTWLISHDAEARQHKLYAVLLLGIAFVEYLRETGRLSKIWRTWAFPMLAIAGIGLLLIHDHGGHSGLAAGWDNSDKLAKVLKMAGIQQTSGPDLQHSFVGAADAMETVTAQHNLMPMETSQSQLHDHALMAHQEFGHNGNHHHSGLLTVSTPVEAQHLWFAVVGIAIVIFKFLHDGDFWQRRFVFYVWPSCMLYLGVLLTLYTERR